MRAGQTAERAPWVGCEIAPEEFEKHRKLGVIWADGKADFKHALGLKYGNDEETAEASFSEFVTEALAQTPEYSYSRVSILWRKKHRGTVAGRGEEDKPLLERQVLSLVLCSNPDNTRLVRSALNALSKKDLAKLDAAYKCARLIFHLHTVFTANSEAREENNSDLREDLPSPSRAFRAQSQEHEAFTEKYPNVADYEEDDAASDRYWTLLFSFVVWINKQFNQGGTLQIGEETKLRSDGTFELAKTSKLRPLEAALNAFALTRTGASLPSDQSRSLPVEQDGVAQDRQVLEAEIQGLRRELEDQKEAHRQALEDQKEEHRQALEAQKQVVRQLEAEKQAIRHHCDGLEAKNADLVARYEQREESLNEERAYFDKERASFREDLEIQSNYGEYLLEEGSLTPERAPQLHEAMALAMLRLTGTLPREPLQQVQQS